MKNLFLPVLSIRALALEIYPFRVSAIQVLEKITAEKEDKKEGGLNRNSC